VLAAATALLSAALAGLDGTAVDLQVSGRAETSARAFVRDGDARQLVATDVLPRLSLLLDRKTLRGALGWEPQLRLSRELAFGTGDATLAHGGFARAEWDLHPLWRATGALRGSVRLVDLVTPTGGAPARLLELRAPDTTVRFLDAGATAGIEGRPARLLTVRSGVAIEDTRGLGAGGGAAMPAMRELRAEASVAREQTRVDVLRLELAAARGSFAAGGRASLATLGAGWARQATRTVRLRLAASLSQGREGSLPPRAIPGAEAELETAAALGGRPFRARAALRAGPALDRYEAGVQERLGLDGAVGWDPARRWSVDALGAAGRVREARGYLASRGELRGGWRASRRLTLFATAWGEWHRDPRLAAGATASAWGTSMGVELAPLPPRGER
jgi:hypothetical protein